MSDDYKVRVAEEAVTLRKKIDALLTFIHSTKFMEVSRQEQGLLTSQLDHMQAYYTILTERMKLHVEG